MILDEIIKKTKEDLKKRKSELNEDMIGRAMAMNPFFPRDAINALKSTEDNPYRIIAEVKKASPSKGVIREDFDPLAIANAYEMGGASAFSVLTEPHWFKGDIEYLSMIRRHTSLPILRKDFIIDRYQILEALFFGADFVLLIATALSTKELKTLLETARSLGMQALVEIHDKADLTKAVMAGSDIIGINHRNLKTFDMDMSLSAKLVPLIPKGKIIVAESGIHSHDQLIELNKIGVDSFLIGEHFMRQSDIVSAVRKILAN